MKQEKQKEIITLDYNDPTNYKLLVCIDSKNPEKVIVDTYNDFPKYEEDYPKEKGDPWMPLLKALENKYYPTDNLLELHYLLQAAAKVCYRITNYENEKLLTDIPTAIMKMLLGDEEKPNQPQEKTTQPQEKVTPTEQSTENA